MNSKELTSLAIKVFAIYVLVQSIILIAQFGVGSQNYFQESQKLLLLIPLFSIAGLIVAFFILWKLSNKVFEEIVKPDENSDNFKVDQIFILHLVGFYLVMGSLFGLGQSGITLYYVTIQQANEYGSAFKPEMSSQILYYIFSNILKLLIGVTLLIKPNGWVKLLYRLRGLGLSNK